MRQLTPPEQLCVWLNQFSHPCLRSGWASQPGLVYSHGDNDHFIELPFAANALADDLRQWITTQESRPVSGEITIRVVPKTLQSNVAAPVKGVKNLIAVTSGKGGVGKSTTAVNLALALAASHARVGLLDADIYGPSVPMMLGTVDAELMVRDERWMQPVQAHGLYSHSIGYLMSQDDAAVWRGPMASKAFQQLLNETEWPSLDYLVVDMPPGTGDIQLTLSQQMPVTGAVVVTTPQDLALADARKGVAMFEKVNVPVIGLVENMSYHICSQCGHQEHIFGSGGAEKMTHEYGLNLLAKIPLHLQVREDIDAGCPTVVARPESEHTRLYLAMAEQIASRLYWDGQVVPDAIPFTNLS
ncbi:iron-sulfur cluster carrier protein ApbC [Vibrio mangrovi]|uniref:Iron-sulfur cluster carrier protein n=1 Tax=Vibrio mangrovi TaxID=474394 RepID=A0A1Y6IQ09_9VIBR|nr:iron-sulfur cluster carrier protein ApbC [Vibrio mangrovi]MDW6003490.1 iron-sulfur cluster carrier protein ApbC [Vibrio mangrovi]SMR99718.1 Septum site-determining protein MinD [Vibrio mangrovi]